MKPLPAYLAALLLLLSSALSAQSFYTCHGNVIRKVTLTPSGCTTIDMPLCTDVPSYSIAIYNDTLYYVAGSKIHKAIIGTSRITNCVPVGSLTSVPNALTVDKKGILYFVDDKKLYSFDPASPTPVHLGTMPYSSAGDLVFFEDALYMASRGGIVEVNIADPALSTLLIPVSNLAMFGLATVPIDCKTVKVFGLLELNGKTDLVEIDLDNNRIQGSACTLPFAVLDAASNAETGQFSDIQIRSIVTRPECATADRAQLQFLPASTFLPYTYTLSNGQSNTTGLFDNLAAGSYGVKITAPGGCEKDTFALVPQYTSQKPFIQPQKTDPTCSQPGRVWFDLQGGSGTYRILTDDDTFPAGHAFTHTVSGTYRYSFLDENDCIVDSFSIDLLIREKCDTVYFPTAFTPNNDNRNDVFKGSNNYSLTRYRLQVFNRWGELVFQTTDRSEGWNGHHKGVPQPTGVYLWIATYTTAAGVSKVQKGTTTLIR